MFEKIFDLGGCSSQNVDYVNIHDHSLTKIASDGYTPSELVEVMEKLRPRPEGRYVLLNALGAHEYWGVNRNGDAFPEWALKGLFPPKSVQDIIKYKVRPKMPNWTVPAGRYGQKTFVSDAHVYVGHANNDPAKSIGDVVASAYNDEMHRVELIVFIYTDRHPDAVAKIDNCEPLAFSMGAKLHFDVCSVCLNPARTRGEYCDHLRSMMGQTMPDGRRVFAYNFFPRFFDISVVNTPADRSAWALKKVASLGGTAQETRPTYKFADLVKRETTMGKDLGSAPVNADVINFLRPKCRDMYMSQPTEDPNLIAAAKGFKMREILASLSALGILLRPAEVTKLSSSTDDSFPVHFSVEDINSHLVRKLTPFIEKRSYYDPHFSKQATTVNRSARSAEDASAADPSYVEYLRSVNFTKLAEWLDTDAAAKVTLGFEDTLFKIAGVSRPQAESPQWLPFFTAVSSFKYLTN